MILPEFLTQDADGEIRLSGHRIGLYTVIRLYQEGRSVEQIAGELPTLPIDLVRKVIAFAGANPADVDAYVKVYRVELDRQREASSPGPGVVRVRQLQEMLTRAEARYASDPGWSALSVLEKLRRLRKEDRAEPW